MKITGIMASFDVVGLEKIPKQNGCVVVANHPTLIDVCALIAILPPSSCIVKTALWRHPFIGGVVRWAGYIPNDDAVSMLTSCKNAFSLHRPLIIFPEGTRSSKNDMGKFSRGAAQIALRTNTSIMPVLIQCNPSTLQKEHRWFDIPQTAFSFKLTFFEEIMEDEANHILDMSLRVRKLTQQMEQHFQTLLKNQ